MEELDVANFAVGTIDTLQFKTDTPYSFKYPLEMPTSEACIPKDPEKDPNGAGYVEVKMAVFANTCTYNYDFNSAVGLEDLVGIEFNFFPPYPDVDIALPIHTRIFTCPHLIGFGLCEENDNYTRYTLESRLCAPTGGVWEIDNPGVNKSGGGYCLDNDFDGFFANVPNYSMNGHLVGDCKDDDPSVTSGNTASLVGNINYPLEGYSFEDYLAVQVTVQDLDGISLLSLTVDADQTPECISRYPVEMGGEKQHNYLLKLNLPECLGDDEGTHSFRVWAKDQCGNVDYLPAESFSYDLDTLPCKFPSQGEIHELKEKNGMVSFNISGQDSDGVIMTTLNINNIDSDDCKLRIPLWEKNFPKRDFDLLEDSLDISRCLRNAPLEKASLWVADRCGNVEMVHSFEL